MKKFKLSTNDFKSLKNTANLIENNVLKNAVIDVSSSSLLGGKEPDGWGKVCGWTQIIDCLTPAID